MTRRTSRDHEDERRERAKRIDVRTLNVVELELIELYRSVPVKSRHALMVLVRHHAEWIAAGCPDPDDDDCAERINIHETR